MTRVAKNEDEEVYTSKRFKEGSCWVSAVAEWFIKQDEESGDLGPLRPPELLKLVREGRVVPESLIRKDDSAYFEAGTVGGLFEAAMRPTIEHFCPGCEHAIAEPPTTCPFCGREIYKAITKITENTIDRSGGSAAGQAGRSVKNWLMKKRIVKDDPEK